MDHQRPLTKLLIAGALVALAAALLVWLREPGKHSERTAPAAEAPPTSDEVETPPASEPSKAAEKPLAEPTAAQTDEGATRHSNYDPSLHPHPITPEHERIHREVDLLDLAWQAVKIKDFAKARELVKKHQREYPTSNVHMDEGMLVLADCMEHPGPDTKARAQQYYDTRTFSQMRRRIRRLCLEVVPD